MPVDNRLHMMTTFQAQYLHKKIEEQKDRIGSFVVDCNEDNWDSYNAEAISVDTIKFTADVLEEIEAWFKQNIGFLNNRSVEFHTTPSVDGDIHIEINYDDHFEIDIWSKHGDKLECSFHPRYQILLDGTRTIADREFPLVFSEDKIEKMCKISALKDFLNEGFYEHRWNTTGSNKFAANPTEWFCDHCKPLALEVGRQARNNALEDAASIAEKFPGYTFEDWNSGKKNKERHQRIAKKIRTLQTKINKDPP